MHYVDRYYIDIHTAYQDHMLLVPPDHSVANVTYA